MTIFLKCHDNDEDPLFGMYQLVFITYTKDGEIISKVAFNQERGNFYSNYLSQSYIIGNKLYDRTVGPIDPNDVVSGAPQTVPSVTTVYELNMDNGIFEKIGESTSTAIVESQRTFNPSGHDYRINGVSVQYPQ